MERISHDNYELIILEGRVDQAESEELESILSDCVEDGKINICIDMIDVKHICSSALGVLVAIKRKIKDNEGDIKLVIASDNLIKLFETTMLNKVFEIYESRRECLSNFD
ncbi:MAG TPA: STAS domain-containing protein [Spirochaetota bacterium]|nr:STAS domain-containing protein [Spirochaetota bacterium]HPS86081.1 STAS domain-containing protein [Spirochaetota bacterium]